jgi:hypothetical protein
MFDYNVFLLANDYYYRFFIPLHVEEDLSYGYDYENRALLIRYYHQ